MMLKNYSQLLFGIIIGLLLGIFIGKQYLTSSPKEKTTVSTNQEDKPEAKPRITKISDDKRTEFDNNSEVPQKTLNVLRYVKENGKAMEGYVGGRVFSNREGILPKQDESGNKMQYNEWDVNPKMEGQNRGVERLVTSQNGRAWYTNDHYRSFIEIK